MVMIDRHLDGKKKHSFDVEAVYNLSHFLSPIWLPHGQLLAIVKGVVSLSQCYSLRLILIWLQRNQESRNKVWPQSPTKHLVRV